MTNNLLIQVLRNQLYELEVGWFFMHHPDNEGRFSAELRDTNKLRTLQTQGLLNAMDPTYKA